VAGSVSALRGRALEPRMRDIPPALAERVKAFGAAADTGLAAMLNESLSIDRLLEVMPDLGASDLHVTTDSPPVVRVRGHVARLDDFDALTADDTRELIYRILSTEQQKQLEVKRQLDFSYRVPGLARFRVNVYFQRGAIGAAFRLVPDDIKTLAELGLPGELRDLAFKPRGLVLVTGPTGSGKSTTLATLIDEANRSRAVHILTIEDPIEFVHHHKRSIVNQREIGQDAPGFAEALRAALRQDPDVILLGEMRDLETISTALTAAETGHLVLATLHTQSAPSTIERVIDVFPAAQQGQVRMQLSLSLQGIITQALVPSADGRSRIPALEILLPDDAVRNLIRQGKGEQIYSVMQTNTTRGMQTMEQSLADLVFRRVVTKQDALAWTSRSEQFESLLERAGHQQSQVPSESNGSNGSPKPSEPAPLGAGLRVVGNETTE
jgi:twitching motility protein PilT